MYLATTDNETYITLTGRSISSLILSLMILIASVSYILTPFPAMSAIDTEIEILDISPSVVSAGDDITVTFFSKYSELEDTSITVWIHEWSSDSQRTWSESDGENAYHVNVSGSVSLEPPVESDYHWEYYYYYYSSSSLFLHGLC